MRFLGWFDAPKKIVTKKTAILGCFFGNNFFWAIELAQKPHGTLDPPAAHFFCMKKECWMPFFAPYSRFWAHLGCFFGNNFFWSIQSARKPPGTLDPPAAHFFVINIIWKNNVICPFLLRIVDFGLFWAVFLVTIFLGPSNQPKNFMVP